MGRGRPTKLTPERQAEIVRLLRAGNYVETVCAYVGITKESFYEWLRRGRRGWKIDTIYSDFTDAVERARAAAEMELVVLLRKSATAVNEEGNMEHREDAKWFLQHAYPDRWGRVQRKVEHTGEGGGPVTIRVITAVPRPGKGDGSPDD